MRELGGVEGGGERSGGGGGVERGGGEWEKLRRREVSSQTLVY